MWTSALWVAATAAATPPATTRQAHTSANAGTASGGWATTANVRSPRTKTPSPALHHASGNGASPFLFAFSILALENVGKRERGRNSLPSRRAGIPFFVGAVSQNISLAASSREPPLSF